MPAPVCWWRERGLWYQCLAPDMTTLKGKSLHMLLQSSVGWRDVLNRALLCKELLSRLVDVIVFACAGSFWTTITARTTTSVSTVRTCIWWWPCCATYATCSIMRVSASSWLHGASELTSSCCGTQITCSTSVITSYLPTS